MAQGSIDDSKLIFTGDGWPGSIMRDAPPEADTNGNIFTNSDFHNVQKPAFQVGTVVSVIDPTTKTPALFRYMQMGTAETSNAVAALSIVGMQITTAAGPWDGKLTNEDDPAKVLVNGPCLVALSAITNDYYGWWFQAGEVPIGTVSALNGLFTTDRSVAVATPACALDTAGNAYCALKVHIAGAVVVAICTSNDADV